MEQRPLIFVMYDSVYNSVFEGQIIRLLENKQKGNPYQPIHLVTFEYTKDTPVPKKNNIQITVLKKIPFIGQASITYAVAQLKAFVQWFPSYSIIARGPIAGLIAKKAASIKACSSITIQARGLLALEYQYSHTSSNNILKKAFHRYRTYQLYITEKVAYVPHYIIPTTIEAVSPALKKHLSHEFNVDPAFITITTEDIPKKIAHEQVDRWCTAVRTQLTIPKTATVYCYNGSAKTWQQPEIILSFFKQKYEDDSHSFLLILTTDHDMFTQLIKRVIGDTVPQHSYALVSAPHTDIYRYLSAADYGLLFRDDHPINWVSRPTKALEYKAVGLPIIHNNTVDYVLNHHKD